jgi:hypothetical protein
MTGLCNFSLDKRGLAGNVSCRAQESPAPPPPSSASKMVYSDQDSFRKDHLRSVIPLSVVPLERRPRHIRLSIPLHHVPTSLLCPFLHFV